MRVLVVDDVPDVLDCIRTMLSLFGYEIEIAESAREALEKLASRPFDVLVSDISMPEMNGIVFLETLRSSNSCNRDIYTIALSGYSRDLLTLEKAGFNSYVMKTDYECLLREIECEKSERKEQPSVLKAANRTELRPSSSPTTPRMAERPPRPDEHQRHSCYAIRD